MIASLANAGLSRRPLCPVHPRAVRSADGTTTYRWTRRARGQYRWEDGVEVPLIEEREAYLIGFGPAEAPHAVWQADAPAMQLTSAERAILIAAHGSGPLWVRQVGTFDRSPPLLLADLA